MSIHGRAAGRLTGKLTALDESLAAERGAIFVPAMFSGRPLAPGIQPTEVVAAVRNTSVEVVLPEGGRGLQSSCSGWSVVLPVDRVWRPARPRLHRSDHEPDAAAPPTRTDPHPGHEVTRSGCRTRLLVVMPAPRIWRCASACTCQTCEVERCSSIAGSTRSAVAATQAASIVSAHGLARWPRAACETDCWFSVPMQRPFHRLSAIAGRVVLNHSVGDYDKRRPRHAAESG